MWKVEVEVEVEVVFSHQDPDPRDQSWLGSAVQRAQRSGEMRLRMLR